MVAPARRSLILLLALPLGTLGLAACRGSAEGVPCTTSMNCPTGYLCASGTCTSGSAVDASANLDAKRSDGRRSADVRRAEAKRPDVPFFCSPAGLSDLYVDASARSGGNGSMVCPYRTISQALAVVVAGVATTIHVAQGTYNAALGEVFPLIVPGNVTILGESAPSRTSIAIDGSGTYPAFGTSVNIAIKLSGTLNYVEVTDSTGTADAIVLATEGTPSIITATIMGGKDGILLVGWARLSLQNQVEVYRSAQDGIHVDAFGGFKPSLTMRDSSVHDNLRDGVRVNDGASIDLGLVSGACTAGSGGNNFFYCNGQYGVNDNSSIMVSAAGDHWTNSVPMTGTTPSDYNGSVSTACALSPNSTTCLP